MCDYFYGELLRMTCEDEQMLLPFSNNPLLLYLLELSQWLTRSNPLKKFCFETAIGNFNGGYFMNKMDDCLMISSYTFAALTVSCSCTLTKMETNECRKAFAF